MFKKKENAICSPYNLDEQKEITTLIEAENKCKVDMDCWGIAHFFGMNANIIKPRFVTCTWDAKVYISSHSILYYGKYFIKKVYSGFPIL